MLQHKCLLARQNLNSVNDSCHADLVHSVLQLRHAWCDSGAVNIIRSSACLALPL